MKVRLRILSRGDGAEPLAPADQPTLFERVVTAHVGTAAEWFIASGVALDGHKFESEYAVIVEDQGLTPGEGNAGVMWNPEGTGPCWLLGINLPNDVAQLPVPRNGFRLAWEPAA